MLKFDVGNKSIKTFEKPFLISFKTNKKTNNALKRNETFPKRVNFGSPRNKEEEDFQKLTVFRIDVYKNTKYIVEFFDFTNSDSFDVNNLYG